MTRRVQTGPKKALGQHFLADRNLLDVIGRLSGVGPDDVALEIGPGHGILTRFLAERVRFVHAVEIDRDLERRLTAELDGLDNVRVTFADALRLDLSRLDPTPTQLVANLPYNVATPLVVESLTGLPSVTAWCVMVQREVADRFFAEPSTKAYGAVSVMIALHAVRTGFHPVARTVFRPPPNVDSALVAFARRPGGPPPPAVASLVAASFAHRRKTLANSVALAGRATREQAATALETLGLAPTVRAEALEPDAFVALAEALGT